MPERIVILLLLFLLLAPALRAEELHARIDAAVDAALAREKLEAAPPVDDLGFMRRVFLDLLGTIPEYEEAKAFLEDRDPEKRTKLVDRLLADERYALQQGAFWDLLLFTRTPANPGASQKREAFQAWLRQQFRDEVPWDQLVRKILLAEEEGSAMFHVQYRNKPEDETVAVARLFLGTQLQCARCHDHPFEELKQRDFYGMAAFFVRLEVLEESKGKEKIYRVAEKSSGEVKFTDMMAGDEKKGLPMKAKFLAGAMLEEPALPEDFKEVDFKKIKGELPKPLFSRKEKFADWMTAPENPFFTRAAVNRIWSQFMGRGLVHPVDNLREENKASHPELLELLAKEFAGHDFNLKWLIRELVLTKAYQRSGAAPGSEAAPKYYERARVRPLTAEELMASLRVATGFDKAKGREEKLPNAGRDYIIRFFGEPNDGLGNFQGGVDEHLFLNNGSQLRSLIRRSKEGNLAEALLREEKPWAETMDRIFLSSITALPTAAERTKFAAYIEAGGEKPEQRLEDVLWVLLNSSRFRFNY